MSARPRTRPFARPSRPTRHTGHPARPLVRRPVPLARFPASPLALTHWTPLATALIDVNPAWPPHPGIPILLGGQAACPALAMRGTAAWETREGTIPALHYYVSATLSWTPTGLAIHRVGADHEWRAIRGLTHLTRRPTPSGLDISASTSYAYRRLRTRTS